MDWKSLFLNADGRIGRRDFWIAWLMLLVANVVLFFIPGIGHFLMLVLIWPSICIYSKRLHDMGRTAWLQLFPVAVSFAALVIAMVVGGVAVVSLALHSDGGPGFGALLLPLGLTGLVMLLANIGFLVWVGITPSQAGPNAYGSPPVSLTQPPPAAGTLP